MTFRFILQGFELDFDGQDRRRPSLRWVGHSVQVQSLQTAGTVAAGMMARGPISGVAILDTAESPTPDNLTFVMRLMGRQRPVDLLPEGALAEILWHLDHEQLILEQRYTVVGKE